MLYDLRETLYTRASLDPFLARLKEDSKSAFPWSNFFEANEAIKAGDNARAIPLLKQIVEKEGLNTRIYLQAWHTLRSLEEWPPESQRGYLQGVVVENHMDHGLDIVAAYRDYTARYWNYSGTGVVWEARDREIDQLVVGLLAVGDAIMKQIGLGQHETPPVPEKGYLRIYLMAYDGSCFGHGLFEQLSRDKMGNAAIGAAINLMNGLTKKKEKK
jgi:hypothetical protein